MKSVTSNKLNEVKYHVYVILALIVIFSSSSNAHAVMVVPAGDGYSYNDVVFEDVSLVQGSEVFTERLEIDLEGEYQLSLTDFNFPNFFDSLGVIITTATEEVHRTILGSGVQQQVDNFDLSQGNYYLSLFGVTSDISNLGLYGVQLKYLGTSGTSPVPVPPAIWLLGSALFLLMRQVRRV